MLCTERFEHKPVRSLSFLNGNRGLYLFTLRSVSDSLGRLAAVSRCMANVFNLGLGKILFVRASSVGVS